MLRSTSLVIASSTVACGGMVTNGWAWMADTGSVAKARSSGSS